MNIAHFKLQLIKKLLEVDDMDTLLTISKLLETYEQSQKFSLSFTLPTTPVTPSEGLSEIQKDIDDVFEL